MPSGAIYHDVSCKTCGQVFRGGPNAQHCPVCRAERIAAQLRDYHRRYRRGLQRKIGSIDVYATCGATYTVANGPQTKCTDCMARDRLARRRTYAAARRALAKQP